MTATWHLFRCTATKWLPAGTTDAGGIALLKRKLKDIKEVDATFAVFNASNVVDLNGFKRVDVSALLKTWQQVSVDPVVKAREATRGHHESPA